MTAETLNAPLQGTVCHIKVSPQDHVHAGQTLLGIRDKQMLHLITAQAEADVERLLVNEGQFVEPGDPLVTVHGQFEAGLSDEVGELADPNDTSSWKLL